LINPAAAGVNFDGLSVSLLDRHQWIGMQGAPQTNTFSITKSFMSGPALGAFVANDSYGLMRDLYVRASFSYSSQIEKVNNRHVSLGIAFEGSQYSYDKSYDNPIVMADRGIRDAIPNALTYDVSMGFIFYGDKGFFSVSATNFLKRKVTSDSEPSYIYAMIDKKGQISRWMWLDISYLLKLSSKLNVEMDVTAKLIYKNRIWGGLSYRTPRALLALMGMNYKKYAFGYGFEYSLSKLMASTYGTHELFLSYNIPNNRKKRKNTPACPAYY